MKGVATFIISMMAAGAIYAQEVGRNDVLRIIKKVADWQITDYDKKHSRDTNWENGALFVGISHWAELAKRTCNDQRYYDWLLKIGKRNHWQPGPIMYHADDITVTQTWLRLSEVFHEPSYAYPTIARLDFLVSHRSSSDLDFRKNHHDLFTRWSWCDALYMAPPAFIKLYTMTGKKKYLNFAHDEFRETVSYLYDKDEHLFFRDSRYFDKLEANGRKVFWGRGNGWVIAGLAEILKLLPEKNSQRKYYLHLFKEMSERLLGLQQEDGYWRASLMDAASYPSPETSATGFIAYGLAYGVRSGILDKNLFLPAVMKGWNAMCRAVSPEGRLGYVQPIGGDPQKVVAEMTQVYGCGAFLSLGYEIYSLL